MNFFNHERDYDVTGVISLKSDLTIEVQNKTRNNWLIDFVEIIEMDIGKTTINKFAIVGEISGVSKTLGMYDLVRGISPTIA
nr:hypothetical protein [Tanacetum cinerariifolium]